MRRSLLRPKVASQQGYALLVALLLIAILAVIGSSTLQVAGIDQRIAVQNRKHMLVVNTTHAGTEHARSKLSKEDPASEGIDSGDTWGDFVNASEGEADFAGIAYTHNLGVYWVEATYNRCGNPPPGYSTEVGANKWRSDYWTMHSTARMQDSSYSNINETTAESAALIRKVKMGTCKIR